MEFRKHDIQELEEMREAIKKEMKAAGKLDRLLLKDFLRELNARIRQAYYQA